MNNADMYSGPLGGQDIRTVARRSSSAETRRWLEAGVDPDLVDCAFAPSHGAEQSNAIAETTARMMQQGVKLETE